MAETTNKQKQHIEHNHTRNKHTCHNIEQNTRETNKQQCPIKKHTKPKQNETQQKQPIEITEINKHPTQTQHNTQ